ncbi:retrotransposon hot spot (RHS) protein [Trypanosoma conorhini]|uniref:Retrotransposon hot spot (RHS) protein n=1 Tax=Trypanosoma conorhini TaxID=83891 RepID=A0A3R7NBR0_9TRYP|nr:retrotransposon hot spot (RHS) protein [Trypanosoma conorhini]RNF03935.1 retrotransposon hot spot (RHS) protein [Trypanosoma conorhini]
MPGRNEQQLNASAESPATDVPLPPRHARAEPDSGDSTAPPAQRRRVEAPADPRWTLHSTVKGVLLEREGQLTQIKLNDFLRNALGGRGVVDANENLPIESFIVSPDTFITNEDDLRLILSLPSFKAVREAIEDVYNLRADARKLAVQGVSSLAQWKEFPQKDTVTLLAKGELDAALAAAEANEKARQAEEERAKRIDEIFNRPLPEGFYLSVFNAKWSHVLEFSEGEGNNMVVRMQVREGQPPAQLWDYTRDGITLLPVEDAGQFVPPRPRLVILSSEHEWPYSLRQREDIEDCYINREVERVWRVVQGDLEGEFGAAVRGVRKVKRRLLIGTPGIGKSMGVGSYLLYRLLHYDTAKLQVVVYCFGGDLAFVFEKEEQTVTKYKGKVNITDLMEYLDWRGKKGYVIYDVDEKGYEPPGDYPPSKSWGIIVLSSPNENNFKGWAKQKGADLVVMNCPDENDVKAMCAWETRADSAGEQTEYCEKINKRMDYVGPIPRSIFDDDKYRKRITVTTEVVGMINASNAHNYLLMGEGKMVPANDASHKLVKAVRFRGEGGDETFVNLPVCLRLGHRLISKLTAVGKQNDFLFQVLRLRDSLLSEALEQYGVHAFTIRAFVDNIIKRLKPLKPPNGRAPRPCVLQSNPETHPDGSVELTAGKYNPPKVDVNYKVLYAPWDRNFPLVDGFFFVESPSGRTMVGLQTTTAKEHDTTASTVELFKQQMKDHFNGWETFAEGLSWEIIYVQHKDSTPINTWQKCAAVAQNEPKRGEGETVKKNNGEEQKKKRKRKTNRRLRTLGIKMYISTR